MYILAIIILSDARCNIKFITIPKVVCGGIIHVSTNFIIFLTKNKNKSLL